jgi:purine-binding chemotaxis protein CheW
MTEPAAPDPAAVARILTERAEALARPPHSEQSAETVELVVLAVGPERYGLDTGHVIEVQTLTGFARLPGLSTVWAGLVNLRGTLYALLDLRRALSLPEPTELGGPKKVALVCGAGLTVGLLVDDAVGIARIPVSQIGPPLVGARGATRGEVRGVTPDLLTVLDAEELLADPGLAVREESA